LNGELQGAEIERRAFELLGQLNVEPVADPKTGLSPAELAGTVMRTLISGIADAIAPDDQGGIDAVIDWKSDVNPSLEAIDHYRKQINEYRRTVGGKRALLVFMTRSSIIKIP
jgi:hypothetical protein